MRLRAFAKRFPGKVFWILFALFLLLGWAGRADQVQMSNGDRYVGRVVSLSGDTLVLQSEVLGSLRLPRAKISTILLDPRPAAGVGTNFSRFTLTAPHSKLVAGSNLLNNFSSAGPTNASTDFAAVLQQMGTSSNALRQVQDQLLTGAGPEAQAKFNDLMGGLLSGKIDLAGLRAQAKSTLDQAKQVRGELGEEGGGVLDGYLAILDSFLKETEPTAAPTNAPPAVPAQPPAQTPPSPQSRQ